MADGLQRTEARGHLLHKGSDRVALQIFGVEAIGGAAELPQPSSGLRQRHADVPAAAVARLARPRHHRAERNQIAGCKIKLIRRELVRNRDPGALPFEVSETSSGRY